MAVLILLIEQSNTRVEAVHVRGLRLHFDLERHRGAVGGVLHELELRHGEPALEIDLTVQVLGLDVAAVVLLARCADHNVGGDLLVVVHLDNVAHVHVLPHPRAPVLVVPFAVGARPARGHRALPAHLHARPLRMRLRRLAAVVGECKARMVLVGGGRHGLWRRDPLLPALENGALAMLRRLCLAVPLLVLGRAEGEDALQVANHELEAARLELHVVRVLEPVPSERVRALPVHCAVRLVPLDILVAILDHGDGQHNQQGEHGQTRTDGGEFGEELQDDQDQEEEISHTAELLQQVLEHKVVRRVLGRDHLVRRKNPGRLDPVP